MLFSVTRYTGTTNLFITGADIEGAVINYDAEGNQIDEEGIEEDEDDDVEEAEEEDDDEGRKVFPQIKE